MKKIYFKNILVAFFSILMVSSNTSAQGTGNGQDTSTAINFGTLDYWSSYNYSDYNITNNGYSNHMGNPSPEIYYKFKLLQNTAVSISLCYSSIDTYLYLLDGNGQTLRTNNDNGPLCEGDKSSIITNLGPGQYYIVAEGNNSVTGMIYLQLISSMPAAGADTMEISSEYSETMKGIFGGLDTSKVPNGLLVDVAMEQTNLDNYNGSSLTDSNYVSSDVFKNIYRTLFTSKVKKSTQFKSYKQIDSTGLTYRQPGKIILSGLFYKYAKISDDAVQNNLITVTNDYSVSDKYINGVWQNPYVVKNLLAIAPSTEVYSGKTQQIIIPSSLWNTNSAGTINNIKIDAGDGQGYRTIAPGQAVNVNYPDTGQKILNFKLTLSNNQVLTSHSAVYITSSIAESYPGIQVTSVTASQAFNGAYAQGYMTIKYANPLLGLRKPLIVAEGFDPGNILNPEKTYGETDIGFFMNNVAKSIELNNQLNGPFAQYDIVYVDWKNGTDNLKKNALLLEEVIRKVNNLKSQAGSTSKNVLIGQSMGGVIARWALKDMENHAENHQTTLFISHDAPQQGANIPIGYQFMANHFKRVFNQGFTNEVVGLFTDDHKINSILGLANTPAARQMLINYVNSSGQIDNSQHIAWQNELKNIGYPVGFSGAPLRMIAISNGSECAIPSVATPNSEMLKLQGKASSSFLGDLIGQFVFPLLSGITWRPSFLLGVLPGSNSMSINLSVHTIGNGGGNQVYYNRITYSKKLFWIGPRITTTVTSDNRSAPAGMLTFDSYPAGEYEVPWNPKNDINGQDWLGKYDITLNFQNRFAFVPVTSALDIGLGNVTLTDADYKTKYIGAFPPAAPKNTPFANFITASAINGVGNETHISFNRLNGLWLSQELAGNHAIAPNCGVACSTPSLTISGPDAFCDSAVYTIPNLDAETPVTWSASRNSDIYLTPNGNSVKAKVRYNDTITLIATVSACGGNYNLKKKISEGNPIFGTYNGSNPLNGVNYFSRSNVPSSISASFTWPNVSNITATISTTIPGSFSSPPTISATSHSFNFSMTSGLISGATIPEYDVTLYGTADCSGASISASVAFVPVSGPLNLFEISPNPASSYVAIQPNRNPTEQNLSTDFVSKLNAVHPSRINVISEKNIQSNTRGIIRSTVEKKAILNGSAKATPITQISVYDEVGALKRQQTYGGTTTHEQINIAGLRPGIYFIEIVSKDRKERQKLMVR